jgi:hypothetical protein
LRWAISLVGLFLFCTPPACAKLFHRHSSNARLQKRLHINDLIAEPGTVEIDWGGQYSYTTATFTLPAAVKFTPSGGSVLIGRTEYSVAFDSVSSAIDTGVRSTRFSDRLTFAATSVVFDSKHLDIAVAPQATALLRGDSGVRLGATVIARCDAGGNSIGVSADWSAATAASSSNPAGVWDLGAGYGRHLGSTGVLNRFTPHLNAVVERATGFSRTLAGFAGVEYQAGARIAVDLSGQRYGLSGIAADRQVLLGLTLNLGKLQ